MAGSWVVLLTGVYLWGVVSRATHPARLILTVENHEATALENGRIFVPGGLPVSKFPGTKALHELGPIPSGSKVTFEVKHVDNVQALLWFKGAGHERWDALPYLLQGDTVSAVVVAQGDSLEVSQIRGGFYR